MTLNLHLIQIVHSGAAEMPVRDRKTRRLDDVRFYIQARAEAENRPGVLRNVRLEKSYANDGCRHSFRAAFLGKSHTVRRICVGPSRQCEGGLALPSQGCQ